MGTNAIVGLSLIAAGLADCAVAVFLLGPRIADERRRQLVVTAVLSGGALMILLGAAIWAALLGSEMPAVRPS